MTEKTKKPDLTSKAGKYYINKATGMNKKDSALEAGYADGSHTYDIERSKTYQAIVKTYYKDEILKAITLEEIAMEQVKNIKQDQDRGAKNKAIEMALAKLEPDKIQPKDDEQILIVMRK